MSDSRPNVVKRALVDFNKDWAWAPMDLIVLGLLVVTLAGHWQKSRDLAHACELLLDRDITVSDPDPHRPEIEAICVVPSSGE